MMKIEPLGHRALLRLLDEEARKSAGGIVLPNSSTGERVVRAEVLAVGADEKAGFKPGDVVLVSRHTGTEFERDKERLMIIKTADALAVVEGK